METTPEETERQRQEPAQPVRTRKDAAKKTDAASSKHPEPQLRQCIDAGDLDGAFRLMNGIITEKAGYHARRLGISRDRLEDCIQDVMERIMERWELVRRSDNLVAYIRKITFHTVIDVFRRDRRIPEDPFPEIDPDAADPVLVEFEQDLIPQPDEVLAMAETGGLFNRALQDVYRNSPGCRESLRMYQEAQTCDVSFDAFCRQLDVEHQAMYARFRRCLEQIIDHHLFPKFSELVARLYPNVLRKKQARRAAEGESR